MCADLVIGGDVDADRRDRVRGCGDGEKVGAGRRVEGEGVVGAEEGGEVCV